MGPGAGERLRGVRRWFLPIAANTSISAEASTQAANSQLRGAAFALAKNRWRSLEPVVHGFILCPFGQLLIQAASTESSITTAIGRKGDVF